MYDKACMTLEKKSCCDVITLDVPEKLMPA